MNDDQVRFWRDHVQRHAVTTEQALSFLDAIEAEKAKVATLVGALHGIAQGDECLNRIPDEGPDPDDWDGDPPDDVWPCLCAHHWALYALAHAAGFPNEDAES